MKVRAAASPATNQLKAGIVYLAIAIAVVLGMMNARIASAQDASQVTIPFAFSANHQVFPAGHYRVIRESDNNLTVLSTETGIASGLMVRTTRSVAQVGKNSLVFLHDQSGYHLLTVRFAQRGAGLQTDVSLQKRQEREIATTSTGSTTEVGMN